MAADKIKIKSKDKKEKKEKTDKKEKKSKKQHIDSVRADVVQPSLLADEKNLDSTLSSLFAVQAPVKRPAIAVEQPTVEESDIEEDEDEGAQLATLPAVVQDEQNDKAMKSSRKRKRKDETDDLEDIYLRKLEREAEQEQRQQKKWRIYGAAPAGASVSEDVTGEESEAEIEAEIGNEDVDEYTPPQHESQAAMSLDLDKAGRTVFIGNVSITAITSKSARKTLEKHLTSFLSEIKSKDADAAPKLESIRFRSTPYAPSLPKKAAYARGEVMTTTAQSTNAYAVYSTTALAREACKRLNGTVVLDRHIRVDSVAHPSPIAHKRCVFVGGLSFVDDESNIIAANEAEGREKRRQNQKPSDVEEGLWRCFAKHGTVESVRVVRDKGTRVGIGIAYVQFTDENAVESALTEDGKKFPPMLPRKMRVTRAKAMKRKAVEKPRGKPEKSDGYKRKITPGEATLRGRVGKLMGAAAAAMASKPGFKGPESFVFEGHRASSKQKTTGLKLGKKSKSKGKPTNRSARRGAAYKAGQKASK